MREDLISLTEISQRISNRIDYIQGTGGNTSVKLTDELMAIKASGFELSQLTEDRGFAIVNHRAIKSHLVKYQVSQEKTEDESQITQFILAQVSSNKKFGNARPSMETGFHTLLRKFVIHSHSVYANIINCSKEGKEILGTIKNKIPYRTVYVPYFTPGAELTIAIRDSLKTFSQEFQQFPEIILLENHGMIVSADKAEDCLQIHENFNAAVKQYFHIQEPQLFTSLEETVRGICSSNQMLKTLALQDITGYSFKDAFFPDQAIFLHPSNISFQCPDLSKKINISYSDHLIYYHTKFKEAEILDELILSVFFLYKTIRELHFTPRYLSESAKETLIDMESEKFRKKLLK